MLLLAVIAMEFCAQTLCDVMVRANNINDQTTKLGSTALHCSTETAQSEHRILVSMIAIITELYLSVY